VTATNTLLWMVKKLATRSRRPATGAPASVPTACAGGEPGALTAMTTWSTSAASTAVATTPCHRRAGVLDGIAPLFTAANIPY
jgi:hypothetical protein